MIKVKPKDIEGQISIDDCLAKTGLNNGVVTKGLSVADHCILAESVAESICDKYFTEDTKKLIPSGYQTLVALHDIGKISLPFQSMIWKSLGFSEDTPDIIRRYPRYAENDPSLHHSVIGFNSLAGSADDACRYVIGAHHGGMRGYIPGTPEAEKYGGKPFSTARKGYLDEMLSRFGKMPEFENDFQKRLVSGLTIASDWIASAVYSCDYSTERIRQIAEDTVIESGFRKARFKQGLSFEDIFGFKPRKVQEDFYQVVDGPGVYFLEAEMGQGKTEAALYAAYRMISEEKASGLYFALPTRLTSLKIYERVSEFAEKASTEESLANVMLAFSGSLLFNQMMESEDSWFAERKRMLLAPIGVGTIDQALMSIIAVKYSDLRVFGLAGKVVILDEVHSYDVYTGRLIKDLVKLLVSLGCTVIVLSATLRMETRAELAGTDNKLDSSSYPLISSFNSKGIKEISEKSIDRTVRIIHLEEDDNKTAFDLAIEAAEKGSYVIWIENTVREAQEVFRELSDRVSSNVETGLIHSRFCQIDRTGNEEKWTGIFGKTAIRDRQRSYEKGYVLVGTQVLEQSLDIDADLLVTRIAPVDMLFQRMGRLWRHDICNRPVKEAVCCIMHPRYEDATKSEHVFGPTGYVYEEYVLWRTLKEICSLQSINIPGDIRTLLEGAYREQKETEHLVCEYLDNLKNHAMHLSRLARLASSPTNGILPDTDGCTRYSEKKTIDILLIRSYNVRSETIKLIDDTCISLRWSNRKERAGLAKRIQDSIVSVSEGEDVPPPIDDHFASMLKGLVYIKDGSERLRLGIISEDDTVQDTMECTRYNSFIGYYQERKRGSIG